MSTGTDLRDLLFALEHYPDQVEMLNIRTQVTDKGRINDKRPAFVTMDVPDDCVKSLNGPAERGDTFLLVRIPRNVRQRAQSRIVLPGEIKG